MRGRRMAIPAFQHAGLFCEFENYLHYKLQMPTDSKHFWSLLFLHYRVTSPIQFFSPCFSLLEKEQ